MKKFFVFIILSTLSFIAVAKDTISRQINDYDDDSDITLLSSYNDPFEDPDGDGDSKGANHFPMYREPTGKEVFIFDPKFNAWALYDENGKCLNTGRASGGKKYCPDVGRGCKTITGKFRVISKGGSGCVSSKYPIETNGGAPMPYCMHFSPTGYAVHGSGDVPDRNASHGCIRVTPVAAKWLNLNHMDVGTTVIVLPY